MNVVRIIQMILGLLFIVLISSLFTSLLSFQTCVPVSLYSENEIVGFGGSLFDGVYDSLCSSLVNANNGLWNAYRNIIVGMLGQTGNIGLLSADLWGIAKFFCQTHTNYDYATQGSFGAITSPDVLGDLIMFEMERCWNIFEGGSKMPDPKRHPLGRTVTFDCAEIIYDFTQEEGSDYLTFKDLLGKLLYTNYCDEDLNVPVMSADWEFAGTEFENVFFESIMWCGMRDNMENYWTKEGQEFAEGVAGLADRFLDYQITSFLEHDANQVTSLSCEDKTILAQDTSACMPYNTAVCTFGRVPGYSKAGDYTGDGNDWGGVIDGCGRIVISYFDYFDWGALLWMQNAGDNYKACNYVDVFNNFNRLYTWHIPRKMNSILICYEKYGSGDECNFLK